MQSTCCRIWWSTNSHVLCILLHIVFFLICVQVSIRCSLIIRWCLFSGMYCVVVVLGVWRCIWKWWLWAGGWLEEGYWGGEWVRNLGQRLLWDAKECCTYHKFFFNYVLDQLFSSLFTLVQRCCAAHNWAAIECCTQGRSNSMWLTLREMSEQKCTTLAVQWAVPLPDCPGKPILRIPCWPWCHCMSQ